jgi:hypothetical protein
MGLVADDTMPNTVLQDVERLAEAGELEAAARRVADVAPWEAWRSAQVLELALERPAEAEPLYRRATARNRARASRQGRHRGVPRARAAG